MVCKPKQIRGKHNTLGKQIRITYKESYGKGFVKW